MVTNPVNQLNKERVRAFWQSLERVGGGDAMPVVREYAAPGCTWHGPVPVGDLAGGASFVTAFWQPLLTSFPDLHRQTHVFIGGASSGRIDGAGDGRMWVGGTGVYEAVFERDYLGIPASGRPVAIRWGEFCRLENAHIVEVYFLLDLVDLMQQAGCDVLPPARGADGVYPPPAAGDGVLLDARDEAGSAHTLAHIRRFIFEGLNRYDQADLRTMGMRDYFHPQVQWYGPGGIGHCDGFDEFETLHQRHWLHAFPDRRVQNLDALIAEGPYSGAPGWAGVRATHRGEYLGVAATGREVVINGLDFWKLEDERYTENWVFVDMVHLFRQLGIDLLAKPA